MADLSSFKEERRYKKLKKYLKREREKEEEVFKGNKKSSKGEGEEVKKKTYREAEKARLKYLNDQLSQKLKKRNIAILALLIVILILLGIGITYF